jgi:hypothetical protein
MRTFQTKFRALLAVGCCAASVAAITGCSKNVNEQSAIKLNPAGKKSLSTVNVSASFGPYTGTPWLGFGYNQYPLDRTSSGGDATSWSSADWSLTTQRTSYIKPAFVRIVAYRDWFNPGGVVGTYNWNTTQMQQLYQVLSYYKSLNIPVMTGLWHTNLNSTDNANFYVSANSDTSFQQLQEDYFWHLIKYTGYTNIVWYTPTNEPESTSTGFTFSNFSTAIHNTLLGFQKCGVPTNVLTGADSWGNWTPWAAQWNSADLSGYDHHYYLNNGTSEATSGQLQTNLQNIVTSVYSHDNTNKPVFLSESGFTSASNGAVDYWYNLNPVPTYNPTTPAYGLTALDYGIQVAASTSAGSMAWSLDGFDQGKDSGMWQLDGQHGGTTLRPWYYTWSLLCRFFPAGGTMFPITSSQSGLHGMGLKMGAGGNNVNWSIAMVNDTGNDLAVTLSASGWGGGTFSQYTYTLSSYGDGSSLSLPSTNVNIASMQNGFTITVPANGGIVLTSIGNASIPPAN